ncbi:LOW QUALITY PROTEIN: protein FAM8A1 [Peromyscus leucopus]|uniref:LOW QUALITY PROTEIN: protein FAM8A1 n=1 Tax=Peromyscus leucopus TaxID=10041 RepID=UPI0018853634|nr:LOW QUALITY PROTEIN: protein FAM8A1 [Peromyscus leucopus]
MAEGPEEARSRPPGQDGGGGDHEPVPSGPGSPSAAAPRPPALAPAAPAASEPELPPPPELRKRREGTAGPQEPGGCEASDGPGRLSAREYSRQVHEWLWQSYCGYLTWHSGLAALPAYCGPPPAAPQPAAPAPPPPPPPPPQLAYYNPFYFLSAPGPGPGPGPGGAATGGATPTAVAGLTARAPHVQASGRAAPVTRVVGSAAPARTASDAGRQAGREYVIPSLAHRFMAEMVDFFILFFIKATIVLSIMHLSGIKDISKFAMHYIIEEIDEDTSMEDLQKMMIVALIYRLLVCFYEIICIWGAGGATPGKFLLGLRVVTCDTSVLIAPSRVLVIPSSNVSITTSTIRALIKNFSIASFFPAFITLLFFQHNRTAYDIVAGTIVVKRNGVR